MALINERKVKRLLSDKGYEAASRELALNQPLEAAQFLSRIALGERALLFRFLKREFAGDVFSYLKAKDQNSLIKSLGSKETKELLSSLRPDDRTDLFEELPASVTKRLLALLSKEDLAEAKALLGYPAHSVGRSMTPDYVALDPDWTTRKALCHIRKEARESETIDVLYVVDRNHLLMGSIRIKSLILSAEKGRVRDIMERPICISAFADREEAVKLIKEYDLVALPVVDSRDAMLGIVTVDDLMDISDEETTEDFYKFAAISQSDDEAGRKDGLLTSSFSFLYKRRIGWLLLLLVGNVFSGAIISNYEGLIASAVVLVFFLPLLIDSGGNSGAQSATIMIRSLATGEVKLSDWFPLLKRELSVALALGLTMGLGVSVLGVLRGGMDLALVVFLTMVCIVLTASLIGMSLPFLLSKLGKDPATASAPLITSLADIMGIAIYLTIASLVLGT